MSTNHFVFIIITLLTLLLAGCAQVGAPTDVSSTSDSTSDFPLTVTDDLGRDVTIKTKPERIVSLLPSNTEILFAVGAGEQVVGVTSYCNYPPEAATR